MSAHDIFNDFAGRVLIVGIVWYAAIQALTEWKDWAISKLYARRIAGTQKVGP